MRLHPDFRTGEHPLGDQDDPSGRAGVDGRLNRGRIIRQSIPLRAKLPYIYVYHTYPLNPDVGISHKLLAVSANLVYNNPITSVFVMT